METGRVINRRYLLQRLIKQGQVCAVYQGVDQVLQRAVAVKAVPMRQVSTYRTAIRMTSHFSHPNIIGLYDLVADPEALYLVQEYIEGDEFSTLLQASLSPYEVADFGCQLCQALLYAMGGSVVSNTSPLRKVCHGDLTPAAVLRDRRGLVRINNFALPSDRSYFENWSVLDSRGGVLFDEHLPWGEWSEGRYADDTRAVALLLYQLLAGRPTGATYVEPPLDGQLRFLRGTPAVLCETVARAILRSHPQHIDTVETLYSALSSLADTLEPPASAVANTVYQPGELPNPRAFSPVASSQRETQGPQGTGKLASTLPARESGNTGLRFNAYSQRNPVPLAPAPDIPTSVANVPFNPVAAYPEQDVRTRRSPIALLLLLGLLMFAAFFVVGYFAGSLLFVH